MAEAVPILIVERDIPAAVERVFEAWTTPRLMERWWGPPGVQATGVLIDLRVGGAYRIGNVLPDDGGTVWIGGTFERIDAPHELIYSWGVEPAPPTERVVVHFAPIETGTRVTVRHERVASAEAREQHKHGWVGCLDGLVAFAADPRT